MYRKPKMPKALALSPQNNAKNSQSVDNARGKKKIPALTARKYPSKVSKVK